MHSDVVPEVVEEVEETPHPYDVIRQQERQLAVVRIRLEELEYLIEAKNHIIEQLQEELAIMQLNITLLPTLSRRS